MKKTTRTSFKAFRLIGSCAVLLAVEAALAAESAAPAHHVKSASVNGNGSITIATFPAGRTYEATIKGDAAFDIVLDSGATLLQVVIKNGAASAKLNGEPIDDSRIHLEDNKLRIDDASGEPLFEASVAPGVAPAKPRVMLGVSVGAPDDALMAQLGLASDAVVLTQIFPDTPAADAGLEPYDILVSLDGQRVTRRNLTPTISAKKSGDVVTLDLIRHGEPMQVSATLKEVKSLGFTVTPMTPEDIEHWGNRLRELDATDALSGSGNSLADALRQYQIVEQQLQNMYRGFSNNNRSFTELLPLRSTQEQLKSLRERANELRTKMGKTRADKALTADVREKLLKASKEALKGVESAIHSLNETESGAIDGMPRIQFLRHTDDDNGQGVVVYQQTMPTMPMMPMMPGGLGVGGVLTRSSARLEAMDKRLDRIEAMLELLLDQQKKETAPANASTNDKPAGT